MLVVVVVVVVVAQEQEEKYIPEHSAVLKMESKKKRLTSPIVTQY